MLLDQRHFWSGFGLAVGGTLLFSFKSIFIKLLYQQSLQAHSVLVLRMIIALPIYLVILVYLLRSSNARSALTYSTVSFTLLAGFLGYYLASLPDLMGLELIAAQAYK